MPNKLAILSFLNEEFPNKFLSKKNSVNPSIIKILKTELMARQENCQLIWIPSRIYNSNYKVFGELKFRANKCRHREKQKTCLHKIGEVLQKLFKVKIRLRSFSIENLTIAALDL